MAGAALGQLTPQQIENNAASYRFYSARDLAVANTYLMSVLVGMGASSPATILASASAWKAFSDRDLVNAQTYLLSQFAGTVVVNAQSTNNGVLTTNGQNILISPDSSNAVFTNAYRAIAIGANFPVGSVLGNGIWIGGGGGGMGGSAGSNSISIGEGTGAAGVNPDNTYNVTGAIGIGNQVDDFGPGGIAIGNNASTFLSAGSYNSVVIGDSSNDGGSAVTNCWIFGHLFSNPANNTFYFGNGGGGGTNSGRTRNFVFLNGGSYNDDGAIIGNGFGLTNTIATMTTNTQSHVTTVVVAFTSGTTNGQTIVVNGDTRTWTTNVALFGNILTNSTANGSATNLFNHLAVYPFAGVTESYASASSINLQGSVGQVMTVTVDPAYGTATPTTAPYFTLESGRSYFTNMSAAITLGNFKVPANLDWDIHLWLSNNSGANRTLTCPTGVRGSYAGVSLGNPASYVVTNGQTVYIDFRGYGYQFSNIVVNPMF